MSSNNYPIGIFDSGVGGTSIWKEITTLLPNENTIYLSDSKNAPYGIKSKQLRYSAVCVHLDHPRGYKTKESIEKNLQIRSKVKSEKSVWTASGIIKSEQA